MLTSVESDNVVWFQDMVRALEQLVALRTELQESTSTCEQQVSVSFYMCEDITWNKIGSARLFDFFSGSLGITFLSSFSLTVVYRTAGKSYVLND